MAVQVIPELPDSIHPFAAADTSVETRAALPRPLGYHGEVQHAIRAVRSSVVGDERLSRVKNQPRTLYTFDRSSLLGLCGGRAAGLPALVIFL